jgi:hypothetical protein
VRAHEAAEVRAGVVVQLASYQHGAALLY